MTQREYGTAYRDGCIRTVRFLLSRGLSEDAARETAQAAWVRGWERRAQIRDSRKALTWVNSIALNLYRTQLRRQPGCGEKLEIAAPPGVILDAIDVSMMLDRCRRLDRDLLVGRYLYGYEIRELAHARGCSETALRVRLLRARRNLRRLYEGYPRTGGMHAGPAPAPGRRQNRDGGFWSYPQAA